MTRSLKPGILHGMIDALRGAWLRATARPVSEADADAIAVTISLRDVALLAEAYDSEAKDHAFMMLRRAVLENTADDDMVVQLADDEFAVVMAGVDEEEARGRIRGIYEALALSMYDAGYDCTLAITLEDEDEPTVTPVPIGQICLN
ncbi:hypothetical protein BH11ARM2_BH11ARM2_26030 [soil metagenome]